MGRHSLPPWLARSPFFCSQAPIVVITGASLRFAGGICSLGALHAAGMAGRELHREAPFPRFDAEAAYSPDPSKVAPGRVLSKFGTYVASVHSFDAAAFGLSPSEASLMDPQSRLLLEESCTAVVHSGRYRSDLGIGFKLTAGFNPGGMALSDAHVLAQSPTSLFGCQSY